MVCRFVDRKYTELFFFLCVRGSLRCTVSSGGVCLMFWVVRETDKSGVYIRSLVLMKLIHPKKHNSTGGILSRENLCGGSFPGVDYLYTVP